MKYIVNIKPYSSKTPLLVANEQFARKLGISKRKRGYVSFGTQKIFVDIKISEEVTKEEMFLSAGVLEYLHIPDYPIYEVKANKNEIAIGPCIGILAGPKDEYITKRRLKEIMMNALDYPSIRGAIIVFALDKVDRNKRLIEGYCYDHKTNTWKRGVFPYPLSIYKKVGINEDWHNHFLSVIGDTVFNNYTFGKWEMYRWFSAEQDILPHLPDTRIYESMKDIYSMLQKHKVLYIKPIWGMKGFGVVKVSSNQGKVVFQYRQDEENKNISAEGRQEIKKVIDKLFKPGNHIIQQGLELLKHNGGVVDFRCVMQKDESQKWVCNSVVARYGASGSVVSNISSGGEALPAVELMKEALSLSQTETFVLKEKMISLCMKVCRTLDEYGINYGTLGLDLGIDKNMNIWLIEVNNRRPHPAIALRVNDIPSYYTILATPLYYAKSLAGFGHREEKNNVLQDTL